MNATDSNALDLATYRVIDGRTGAVMRVYPGTKRRAARNHAERLNQAYGAHRYSVLPVFAPEAAS